MVDDVQHDKSVIARLQELLKQANEKYNSLMAASNAELSEHRASYRAATEENEKLREERDILMKIYQMFLKDTGKKAPSNETEIMRQAAAALNNRSDMSQRATNRGDNRNYNNNRPPPYCHYFNNNKPCRYSPCKFRHEQSKQCRDGQQCQRHLCQFQHGYYWQPFLGQDPTHQDRGTSGSQRRSSQHQFQNRSTPSSFDASLQGADSWTAAPDGTAMDYQQQSLQNVTDSGNNQNNRTHFNNSHRVGTGSNPSTVSNTMYLNDANSYHTMQTSSGTWDPPYNPRPVNQGNNKPVTVTSSPQYSGPMVPQMGCSQHAQVVDPQDWWNPSHPPHPSQFIPGIAQV